MRLYNALSKRYPTASIMNLYEYESRIQRPVMMKIPELQANERLKHVIFSGQFDRGLLEHIARVADMIRALSKTRDGGRFLTGLLSHKRAMLYFTQPSTRTFLSFMAACQILGLTCNEVRDRSVSSEVKGESPYDSIRMFSSYFDIIIMRSVLPNFAECCAYLMNDLDDFNQRNVPIINGGSGADEHPTQALLDIYTIQRTFQFSSPKDSSAWTRFDELRQKHPDLNKGLDNKTYGFCGDIGRGRTVRSLASLLSQYENITMVFITPDHPTMRMGPDLRSKLIASGVKVVEVTSFDELIDGEPAIEKIDCLYMTRIQREHDSDEDRQALDALNLNQYCLSTEILGRMKEYTPIMHPFPRDDNHREIPPEIDPDPRAMYFRQARNGMWMRAALVAYLFDVDGRISNQYHMHFSEFHDYNTRVLQK